MLYAIAPTITSRITVASNPIKPNPRLISLLLCVNEICLALILPRSCEGVVNGLWAVCGSGDGPTRRLRRRPPRRGGEVKADDQALRRLRCHLPINGEEHRPTRRLRRRPPRR